MEQNKNTLVTDKTKLSSGVFAVQNNTDHDFFGWIPTTISFPKGETTSLDNYSVPRPHSWRVIKKWDDNSVALAVLHAPFFLGKGEIATEQVVNKPSEDFKLQLHPNVMKFLENPNLYVRATLPQGDVVASPFQWRSIEIMSQTRTEMCVRTRTVFTLPGLAPTDTKLTLTTYIKGEHLNPIVEFTFVIGNDQLSEIELNGIQVNNIEVIAPNIFEIYQWQSMGNMSCLLADGQTFAFKAYVNFEDHTQIFNETLMARAQSQFIGIEAYDEHRANKAFLTHTTLPASRFSQTDIPLVLQVRSQVESQFATAPQAQPKDHLGWINKNPPQTGAQPDFCSTMPADIQKGMQAYSQAALSRVFAGVMRESFRPSFFWLQNHKRPTLIDYPNLFFWSGRPHYHPSWNPEYPEWQTRCGLNITGFDGWGSADNQHMGNNHLRAMYELTGDEYLGDILKYYVSLVGWNFFTKWKTATEAERCMRSMKEAYALGELFSDLPEAQVLKQSLHDKAIIYDSETVALNAQYNFPCVDPTNACDPRVVGGQWCPTSGPQNIAVVGWQTGFRQEFESLRKHPDLSYLNVFDLYFLPDGAPKTYIKLDAPSTFITGGIGIWWWSGWVMMAEKYPQAPASQNILTHLKPLIEAEMQPLPGHYFHDNDAWKAW